MTVRISACPANFHRIPILSIISRFSIRIPIQHLTFENWRFRIRANPTIASFFRYIISWMPVKIIIVSSCNNNISNSTKTGVPKRLTPESFARKESTHILIVTCSAFIFPLIISRVLIMKLYNKKRHPFFGSKPLAKLALTIFGSPALRGSIDAEGIIFIQSPTQGITQIVELKQVNFFSRFFNQVRTFRYSNARKKIHNNNHDHQFHDRETGLLF